MPEPEEELPPDRVSLKHLMYDTVDAVLAKDLPVVLAVAVLSALIYVVMSTLVDILALWIDPRLRGESK